MNPKSSRRGVFNTGAGVVVGELPAIEPDLVNYRPFLRDYFIIRDFDWFGGFWLKHPDFRNGDHLKLRDSCVSQSDWERLYFAPEPAAHLDLMGSLSHGVMLQSALDIWKYG